MNYRRKYLSFFIFLALSSMLFSQAATGTYVMDKNIIEYPENIENSLQKLNSLSSGTDSSFVIVHLGDSHVQMGVFGNQMKKNLQPLFGDAGDGILYPYSACKSVGPTNLKSTFSGTWTNNNILRDQKNIAIGVCGYGLKTTELTSAFKFEYTPDNTIHKTSKITKIRIYHGKNNYQVVLNKNIKTGSVKLITEFEGFDITEITSPASYSDLYFTLSKTMESQSEFIFFGIEFEGFENKGITYHQCGVVGAQFLHLTRYSPLLFEQLKALNPDLIILSYGSNESYISGYNFEVYNTEINQFIQDLKTALPNAEILISSTPDTRSNNLYPENTQEINKQLREIAQKNAASFWDLNAAMGGDGSMVLWHRSGLANNDKLHFSYAGYRLQANLLSLALLNSLNSIYPNLVSTDNVMLAIDPKFVPTKKPISDTGKTINSQGIIYTIKKGDTLYKISLENNCSIESIKKANNLESDTIKIGEKLIIIPGDK